LKDENIKKLWYEFINDNKYKKYFEDNNIKWINILMEVKKYIDKNNKIPLQTDKNKEFKFLGNWLSNQRMKYKNKEQIMKNKNIYNKFTDFINDEKYKIYFLDNTIEWYNNLELVKIYINKNNKRPSGKDNKILTTWVATQISNYKNKEHIMKNDDIYNKWTEFINDKKYEKYFFDNETDWFFKLELVKKYIDNNKRRPSKKDNKILTTWIITQQKNYKNKTQIMSNQNIYNKWTDFINDEKYREYFLDNETEWINILELVKKYIDENNKVPTRNVNNHEINKLGLWIQTQKHKYKYKKTIMLNENIYNKWTEFINDEKYKKYFI
jgi:antitoxin component HigA of HigAB toxin-antitoxin module